jgi:hypothetical protein
VTRTRHSMEPQTPPALHARSEAHPTESLGMAMGATSSGNELMNTTPFVSPANKQHSNQSEHDTQMDGTDVSSNADISTSPGAPTEAERAAVSNNHASDAQESTCIEPTTADELSTPQLKHEEEDEIDLSLPLANSESQVEVFDRPETSDAPTDEQFEHSYSNMLQGVCDLFVPEGPVSDERAGDCPDLPDLDAGQDLPEFDFDSISEAYRDMMNTGDQVTTIGTQDHTGDWNHLQGEAQNVSTEPLGTAMDEHDDAMDWSVLLDVDPASADEFEAAAAFAELKDGYERKVASGANDQTDDILFAQAEAQEHQRLRDIERGQMAMGGSPQRSRAGVDEDSLFVPERSAVAQSQPKKKRAPPKRQNRLSKKDVDEALAAGMQARFQQNQKPKRRARASSKEPQPKKRRQTAKSGGVRKSTGKRGRKSEPVLSNIGSLGRMNIVAAAQANASKPDMPSFTSTNKAKALKELIAGIPSSDRAAAVSDRDALLAATRKFKGQGAMKSDGKGYWKLKGMASSLYHHQLLGAAFLRERESGDNKPHGGMICDEMGFGKTIQMM